MFFDFSLFFVCFTKIQALKNDISRHNQDFETICSLGENLIQTADIDTEVIREQLNELKKCMDDVKDDIGEVCMNS